MRACFSAAAFCVVACGARTPLFSDGLAPVDASDVADVSVVPDAEPPVPDAFSGVDVAKIEDAPPSPPPPPDSPGPTRVAFFGQTGYQGEDGLLALLQNYPASVTRTQNDAAPVTVSLLESFDVVVLDMLTRSYSSDEAAAMAAWVRGGGGLLSLTGYNNADTDWTRPNSILASLSVGYGPTLVLNGSSVSYITDFAAHPVTTGVSVLPFWGGYNVFSRTMGGTALVAFGPAPVGGVAMVAEGAGEFGKGRVYLWGDEWVEFSSVWPGTDSARFWTNAIDWLTHRT